jgi:hypothetical protein
MQEIFQLIFNSEFIGAGRVSQYAATPLAVALSAGHSDITMFRPWSPIATANHLERAPIKSNVARTTDIVDVFYHVQAFRDPLRGKLPHVQIVMNDGPNLLT